MELTGWRKNAYQAFALASAFTICYSVDQTVADWQLLDDLRTFGPLPEKLSLIADYAAYGYVVQSRTGDYR